MVETSITEDVRASKLQSISNVTNRIWKSKKEESKRTDIDFGTSQHQASSITGSSGETEDLILLKLESGEYDGKMTRQHQAKKETDPSEASFGDGEEYIWTTDS